MSEVMARNRNRQLRKEGTAWLVIAATLSFLIGVYLLRVAWFFAITKFGGGRVSTAATIVFWCVLVIPVGAIGVSATWGAMLASIEIIRRVRRTRR